MISFRPNPVTVQITLEPLLHPVIFHEKNIFNLYLFIGMMYNKDNTFGKSILFFKYGVK